MILSSFSFLLAKGGPSNYSTFTKWEGKSTIKMMGGLNCSAIILRRRRADPTLVEAVLLGLGIGDSSRL